MKHHSRRHVLPVLATVTWILGAVSPLLTCDLAIAQTQVAPAKATQSQTAPARPAAAKAEDKKLLKSKDFYLKKEDPGKFEQLARQKREEAIVLLKGILDSGNIEGDQLAEMNMRLAELYWERAKDFYLAEMAAHLEEYGTWADSKDPNKGAAPQENHNNSQLSNRLAIDLYRTILQKHRNYPRMDEVYFNLAFNLMDLGEKQQALEYYQTLVKNYPQSDFVADAYLAMGEHYFENNNAFKALGNYKKASTFTETRVHVFAMYKLGWCYYNVGEYKNAIDVMKDVISRSDSSTEQGKISLKEEALNDLVLFYSEQGDMDAAYAYFSQMGEKRHYKAMLKRLGSTYLEQGKFEQAITTFRKLIAEETLAKDTPTFQDEIINAYFKSGRKEETLSEIDRLASEYGSGSAWAKANSSNQEAVGEANSLIDKNLRQVAIDYHKEARKTGSQKTYELARKSYQKYLGLFPSNRFSYDIRFAYAEVLYELKQLEAAADEYERIMALDAKGRFFQISANSLILTIDKILGIDKKPDAKPEGVAQKPPTQQATGDKPRDLTPKPLNAWEERKVKACDMFAAVMPEHKDAPNTLYEAARLLYDRNQFDKSTPRFLTIIERYGSLEVAEVSANLILDSCNLQQDWTKIDGYARKFYASSSFKPEFKKELRDLFEQASFKKVEPLEKGGNERAAAEGYLAFYTEFPGSSLADRALFNAAFYSFKAGQVRKSVELREKFAVSFPKSTLAGRNLDDLGKLYESFADYRKAAEAYEQLVAWDKARSYAGTADALYNAALFRESLGEGAKAIVNFQTYARDFASRDDAHLAALQVGRIYEADKRAVEAMAAYKQYFSNPAMAGKGPDALFDARLRYGRLLRGQRQNDSAQAHFQESVALYDRMAKGGTTFQIAPLYIAEMRFYMVEPLYSRFARLKLELPKKGQKGNALDEKLKLMEEVAKAYTSVLELKQGEWGIAALCQLGEAYRNLSDTLITSPTPPELTAQQTQIYRAALEDRAFPLKDRAAEALEQALSKSYELGIYNQFTARAATLLAELRPKEYPALAERLGTPEQLTDIFHSADFRR